MLAWTIKDLVTDTQNYDMYTCIQQSSYLEACYIDKIRGEICGYQEAYGSSHGGPNGLTECVYMEIAEIKSLLYQQAATHLLVVL